ncbi:MAG: hypothetical protein ACREI9_08250 [Nitrospiraceae bacterium]
MEDGRYDEKEQYRRRKGCLPADEQHQPAAVLQRTPDLGGVFGLERWDAHFSQRLEAKVASPPQLRRL